MAHFALIEDGIVKNVIVVSNNDCGGGDFPESEPIGQAFIASLGLEGTYLQCSYNGNFRNVFPEPSDKYDDETDRFIPKWWTTTVENPDA